MKETDMEAAIANKMNKHIAQFAKEQTLLTIATCSDNVPHCATCFYVFVEELNALFFKSKPSTKHVKQGLENPFVSGSILPDKFIPGKTSGIQYYGEFVMPEGEVREAGAKHYYSKYPFAAVIPGKLWMIDLNKMVFTDHTLGFGKRRTWEK